MKSAVVWVLSVVLVIGRVSAASVTVNDGTTVTNLARLANVSGAGDATTEVTSNGNVLLAAQSGDIDPAVLQPLRTAWYGRDVAPTTGVYQVSSQFKPAQDSGRNRGGVMGWIDLAALRGIAFHVVPNGSGVDAPTIQVSVVDFKASNDDANEGFGGLYNLDGTPATGEPTSTLAEATGYDPAAPAVFLLAFAAPTAADQAALGGRATARVTATAYQDVDTFPTQFGRTIELLTDQPVPAPANHRVGYYSYWGSIIASGSLIGELDTLTFNGGFTVPENRPPAVVISTPANGASFERPVDVVFAANAADADGTVTRVDFLVGNFLIGTAAVAPFSVTWTNPPPGVYTLTARAFDDRGAATLSANEVRITVTGVPTEAPTLSISLTGSDVTVSWPEQVQGFVLQSTLTLATPEWIQETLTGPNRYTQPAAANERKFFRLVQQ
jgi:hypothetical protein